MTGRLSCPDCGTPLRIRDRSLVGRRVNCPECQSELRVENSDLGDGSLSIRGLTKAELAAGRKSRNISAQPRPLSPPSSSLKNRVLSTINSPLTAIWLVGFAGMALIAVMALNPKLRFSTARTPNLPIDSQSSPNEATTPAVSEVVESTDDTNSGEPQPGLPAAPNPSDTAENQTPVTAMEPSNLDEPLTWSPSPVVNESVVEEAAVPNPQVVRVDVESKLAQKVVLYKQPKISRRILIDALQEQLGIPIRYDSEELGQSRLEEKIAFELQNTTLGEVVKTVAQSAHWRIEVEDTGLRLTKRDLDQRE